MQFVRSLFLSLTLVAAASSSAFAVPVVLCKSDAGIPCVANSGDVLAGGVTVANSGNDFENVVEAAIKSATGVAVDISLYGKSDDNPSLFSFSNFDTGSNLTGSDSGTWNVLDGSLITYITVKAANSFVLYQFGPSSTGVYSTAGILNNGGQQPMVSHISFWTVQGSAVPEPATAGLLLASLAGGTLLRRKQRQ